MIRDTLLAIGGDAVRLFRSGCFGYFLDYRGGDVQKRVIHALMTFEVHAPDRARVGREAWFHIHHSQLRFGSSEYALVSGLRFGSSTFDPHGDHIVPSRSVYHRLFEGKRTTIKQMEERFKELGMARDAADYVKVANILFVYRMILCLDQYRYVDPWVWALAEDVERWNSFPWGAYSYQSLMHYIGLIPRTREAMGGKGSGQYHFYGPIWALQVIPELASEAGVHSGQLTVPRCLRWTFRLPATDPATLLQRVSRVVTLVPSPEETTTSYYMSLQLEPGAQSVRFVPARSGNKKKMLANVASCCSTSAEEVVPPSARVTRAARTPQMARQATSRPSTSRALRDEPDHTEPGARPPTEDALVHTADSIDPESPPRAWGMKRSRRDRTPSSGEPLESFIQRIVDRVMPRVQELIDKTIAPHVQEYVDRAIDRALAGLSSSRRRSHMPRDRDRHSPEPSECSAGHHPTVEPEGTSTSAPRHGGFSGTYQLMNDIDDSTLQVTYPRFRSSGPNAVVQLHFNGDRLRQSWFDHLKDPRTELKDVHISYFLSAMARRVKRDNHCLTTVATTGLYVSSTWKRLYPLDPECRLAYGDDDYQRWRPAEGLIHRIQGRDGRYQVPWMGRDYVIVVCDVANEHWVVVRICFSDWVIELYDSFLFQMDDPTNRVQYERRDRELMPLLRLLPRLLICAGFWEGRQMPSRCAFAMTLDKTIPDQYVQTNGTSCGVYACMYVDRLLGAGLPPGLSEEGVHAYRRIIGAQIYSLTYIKRPSL
ncbi:hypothetical protein C2S51_032576 [Perilla frutescens var. frutescens]|nr:hypothetical protein C2S51_032576 [Perilla frutescens var. frutescens]